MAVEACTATPGKMLCWSPVQNRASSDSHTEWVIICTLLKVGIAGALAAVIFASHSSWQQLCYSLVTTCPSFSARQAPMEIIEEI